jgi:MYXO-CTERM domain-containing protein
MFIRALPLLLLASSALAAEVELRPSDDIKSLTASLGPGSIYVFQDGTYEITGELQWTGIGTESEPIVFRAAPGARPVIQLTNEGSRVVHIYDSEHIKVQGLTFRQDDTIYSETRNEGVRISNSTAVSIESCTIEHVGGLGLYLPGTNVGIRVVDTEISDTRDNGGIYAGCYDASCWTQDSVFANNLIHDIKSPEEGRSDGLQIAPGGQGNEIRDNVIFGVNRVGLLTYSTEYGAQNVIEGNFVFNTGATGMVVSGAGLVRNNLVFNNGGHAFYSDNNRDTLENLVVSFNTFATSDDAAVRLRGWAGNSGMVFANNAVANPAGVAIQLDDDSLDEGNFISTNAMTGQVQRLDYEAGHYVYGGGYTDFEDWQNWNYYPRRGSVLQAAADAAGDAFVPAKDINGFDRNGASPTIGAYEHSTISNPGWLVQEDFKVFEDRNNESDNTTGGCCGNKADGTEGLMVLPLLGLGLGLRRRRRTVTRSGRPSR